MTQLFVKILKYLLLVYVFVFAYQWWRPLPDEMNWASIGYSVPDSGVKFYADYTKKDAKGTTTEVTQIKNRYKELIAGADRVVLISEENIPHQGSSTLRTLIHEKHANDKHVPIAIITDPISTRYGGIKSETMGALLQDSALLIETDMERMPDSNLVYTSFWRPFISWWGNSPNSPWLADPVGHSDVQVPLRSWLAYYNGKSNEAHTLLADMKDGKDGKSVKLVALISSSDISTTRGNMGAVAVEVDDKLWSDFFRMQPNIASMSHAGLPSYNIDNVNNATSGDIKVSMLNVGHTHEKIVSLLETMKQGDTLDISTHFLSDRSIITALKDAANHNATIRMILDPNETSDGHDLSGMPNRPVAKELIRESTNGVTVRWCDNSKAPCETRMMIGKTASTTFMILGSADLTRRDTEGYDIEGEILLESPHEFTAEKDAKLFFNNAWTNNGGNFTVDYSTYEDNSMWRSSVYRMMERTGLAYY